MFLDIRAPFAPASGALQIWGQVPNFHAAGALSTFRTEMFWDIRGRPCFLRRARSGRSENIYILGTPFGVSAGFASRAFRQYIYSRQHPSATPDQPTRMKVWDLSPNFHADNVCNLRRRMPGKPPLTARDDAFHLRVL